MKKSWKSQVVPTLLRANSVSLLPSTSYRQVHASSPRQFCRPSASPNSSDSEQLYPQLLIALQRITATNNLSHRHTKSYRVVYFQASCGHYFPPRGEIPYTILQGTTECLATKRPPCLAGRQGGINLNNLNVNTEENLYGATSIIRDLLIKTCSLLHIFCATVQDSDAWCKTDFTLELNYTL